MIEFSQKKYFPLQLSGRASNLLAQDQLEGHYHLYILSFFLEERHEEESSRKKNLWIAWL